MDPEREDGAGSPDGLVVQLDGDPHRHQRDTVGTLEGLQRPSTDLHRPVPSQQFVVEVDCDL